MQKRLLRWELIGFAFTGAVGTLLHFVYEWTGGNPLIAAFCAVNESTWEHMKLLFVPFFLFTMVQFIVFAEPLRSFFAAKAASILLGLLAIPVLFYSLGGMFRQNAGLGEHRHFLSRGRAALPYELPSAHARRAARRRVAARRLSPAVGAGLRVRVLHLPPHPPPALAGPDEWALRARRGKGRGITLIIWCARRAAAAAAALLAIVLFFLSALLRQQRRADDACAVAERTELDARVTHGIA